MTEKDQKLIAKNLRQLFYANGKTQADASRDLGISKGTLSCWMNGTRIPRMDNIDVLAKYLGVTRADIVGQKEPEKPKPKYTKIPILGSIPAGVPTEMIEDIVDYEEIPDDMARMGEYFGLKIKGHSMEPRISDGDYIIIRKQDTADSGDIVVARINGNEGTCKRLKLWKDQLSLLSDNPACESYHFSAKEVSELPVKILGKVVELRAKL